MVSVLEINNGKMNKLCIQHWTIRYERKKNNWVTAVESTVLMQFLNIFSNFHHLNFFQQDIILIYKFFMFNPLIYQLQALLVNYTLKTLEIRT